jgi:adenylyltransferase/sulfurtransferase
MLFGPRQPLDRYARQVLFPGIGREGQERLAASSVVVIGCGALGSSVAMALSRAGVGRLRLVDRDFIEMHNLQRQILYTEEDVRQQIPKAVAAERHLRLGNSSIQIEGIVADVTNRNVEELVKGTQVIVDALDNVETRYLLNDVSLKHRLPWVYGGAVASMGMVMTFVPGRTPCLRCLYPELPEVGLAVTCDTAGIVNAAPMVVGALESVAVIKLLVGDRELTPAIHLDVWSGSFRRLATVAAPAPGCPACHGQFEFLDGRFGSRTTILCGQNAVQVTPSTTCKVSLPELAERLRPLGPVVVNEFLLRFSVEGSQLVLFPDGRAIVKNISDETAARELYARYIGM